MQKVQKFRFFLLTLFVVMGVALAGGMLIYLSVNAWQAGEFHTRGRILRPSGNPIEFFFITTLGGAFGVALVAASPLILFKALTSNAQRRRLIDNNQKIYGDTRSSLLWLLMVLMVLLVLLGLIGYSFFEFLN